MNEPDVELVIGSEPWHRACSMYVRYRFFVMEKSIAREDEFDQYDEVGRAYANLLVHSEPVSIGRFLLTESGTARLTRIATLAHTVGRICSGNYPKTERICQKYECFVYKYTF